jgi:hypothetical protein
MGYNPFVPVPVCVPVPDFFVRHSLHLGHGHGHAHGHEGVMQHSVLCALW